MKYTLSVFDRLILLNIFPSESNIITLRIVRELKMLIGFSEIEHRKLEIHLDQESGNVHWKKDAENDIEIEIGDVGRSIIVDALKSLNEKNKLSEQHISLYEKFVEGK